MYTFTNAFRCTAKGDGSEFTIQFLQESPTFDDNDNVSGTQKEILASVVMSLEGAKALSNLIIAACDACAAEKAKNNDS